MKLLTIILLTLALTASTYTAKVIRVSDGDTITVLVDKEQARISLEGINRLESGQPFGNRATQLTQKLCDGNAVRIEKTGEDRFGRYISKSGTKLFYN